ncbi:MAG: hypothetical protein ACOX9B_07015 [Candidatus Xenobium sp.]|jgi:hypothetical protein|nr:hypothetical protein [Burkholderiales bacterium]
MKEGGAWSSGGLNLEDCLERKITLVMRDISPFVDCNIGFQDERSRTLSGRLVGLEPEVGIWIEPEQVANQENPPEKGWRILVQWRDILVLMQAETSQPPTLSRLPEKPIGFRSRVE